MAPTKNTNSQHTSAAAMPNFIPLARRGLSKQKTINISEQNMTVGTMQTRGKRKAENSPIKNEKIKRSALGNLTNNTAAFSMHSMDDGSNQKQAMKMMKKMNMKDNNLANGGVQMQILKDTQNTNSGGNGSANGNAAYLIGINQQKKEQSKIATRATSRMYGPTKVLDDETCKLWANAAAAAFAVHAKEQQQALSATVNTSSNLLIQQLPMAPIVTQAAMPVVKAQQKPVRRISNEFNKTEESLYMSALDISTSESMRLSDKFENTRRRSALLQNQKTEEIQNESSIKEESKALGNNVKGKPLIELEEAKVPENVEDFDKANWNDPFQVSCYATDIFNYLKSREKEFPIEDYMEKQVHLSKWMRSLLVDWMVEVQETFELNHETLYLAVKIVDLFLCRVVIYKDKLQLLGAAALFIACKFDERTPPLIEDFLYICDGAYKQDELLQMEVQALKTIGFDLGVPLSYRFLRRYARCGKVPMPTLTLARYILELSLMDYAVISCSDSQLAAAALFMALRLHGDEKPWTPTLEYYSGYKIKDFADLVPLLNAGLHRKPKGTIKTIRSKYSHKIFHEVAKVPLMTNEQLFENNFILNNSLQMQVDEEQKTPNQKEKMIISKSSNAKDSLST